jgi:hypothetical protein
VILEERVEVGLAALEEAADVEGEGAGQRDEDGQEHRGQRAGEIGHELALGDDPGIAEKFMHGACPFRR